MRADPCGSTLTILRDFEVDPARLAAAFRHIGAPTIRGVVVAYRTIGVHHEPQAWNPAWVVEANHLVESMPAHREALHKIPICYELGEDFSRACEQLDLTPADLIGLHTAGTYRCAAIGFCPGFAYLEGLPERLAGLGRLTAPRTRVPAGSLGITGKQCAVYPASVPGGWNLIGLCPLRIVDVDRGFFPIQAGDQIRFFSISSGEFNQMVDKPLGSVL